jgi:glycosyltransferase involved in cell wall biosynthesis
MGEKKIIFLPIWGKQNETIPRQQMKAIESLGSKACYGLPGTIFPLSKSAWRLKPDLISLDWIHQYALSKGIIFSILKSFLFAIDILIVRYLFGVKLVWTMHNLRHHDPRPRNIEKWISRFFASHCDFIRILGKGVENQVSEYLKIPVSKLKIIPEGPYIGWYPEGINNVESRQILEIGLEKKVFLYLGNLRPYKGVEDLLHEYQKIKDENSLLIIAGNPWNKAYAESLEFLAKKISNVKLILKSIPDEELQVFFASADLVVLPFKNVLNSGSALLAMGFAKPVIAPAIGLLPFRLEAQPELLYKKDEGLEAALKRGIKFSKSELMKIGLQNRENALKYTWDDFARFLLSVV